MFKSPTIHLFWKLSLPIFLTFTIKQILFAQWERVAPSGENVYALREIAIPPNSDQVYAFGIKMAHSKDLGFSWDIIENHGLKRAQILPPQNSRHYDIFFPNAEIGYVVTKQAIYKTVDGNQSWEKQLELQSRNGYLQNAYFNALDFVNDSIGFAVGDYDKIFKTTNGGQNWEEISWSADTAPFISLTDVVFLSPLEGYIAGFEAPNIWTNFAFQPFIKYTSDGGLTWTRYTFNTDSDHREVSIQFLDNQVGFLSLTESQFIVDKLFITKNGGQDWEEVSIPIVEEVNDFWWMDAQTGFVLAREINQLKENVLYRTTDGGQIWNKYFAGEHYYLDRIAFSGDNGLIIGREGEILTSSDSGQNWEVRNVPTLQFIAADFNKNMGYALSDIGLVNSIDQGESWQLINNEPGFNFFSDLKIAKSGALIFLTFHNGNVFLSSDNGETLNILSSVPLIGSQMQLVEDKLMIVGKSIANGQLILLSTENLGTQWQSFTINAVEDFPTSISFIDKEVGYVSSIEKLYKTLDGGQSWEVIDSFPQERISRVHFINADTGLVLLQTGELLRTTDGGQQLQTVTQAPQGNPILYTFLFTNEKVGYTVGTFNENQDSIYIGGIWKTEDAGASWALEALPKTIYTPLIDLELSSSDLFAFGGFGNILKTQIEDPVTSVEAPQSLVKTSLYPNPTTGHLMFESEVSLNVSQVLIMDISGRRISSNYSVNLQSSTIVQVDVAALPQGVYLLTISSVEGGLRTFKFIKE